jgi:hypothetical protein
LEVKQVVKLKKQSRIRALDISPSDGRVFLTDYDLGDVYFYKSSVPMSAETPLELVGIVKGPIKSRVIKYWKERNELYIGCAKGKMSVIDITNFNQGPICK